MHRHDLTLLMLAAAGGQHYTPVQIQKAMFLLDRQMPDVFDTTSRFAFRPYDYGPFDPNVYVEIERLQVEGLAEIAVNPARAMKLYAATAQGLEAAESLRSRLLPAQVAFIREVSDFVRRLSFSELVSAIYEAYPDMRQNSIFVDDVLG